MSRHSKGNRTELLCRKELEKAGWLVEKKNWSRFGGKDFFGAFDVLALKKGRVLAIQVKSNELHKKLVKTQFQAIEGHIPVAWQCELWVKKDYKKHWLKFDLRKL